MSHDTIGAAVVVLAGVCGMAASVSMVVGVAQLRALYEQYRFDRDTLNVQLRDAFIAGAAFGRYGEPDQRRIRDEASKLFPWAATNPTRRPSLLPEKQPE